LHGLSQQPPPQAVLITDGEITQHPNVYAKALDYVRSGGTLVFMGTFSSCTTPDAKNKLFQKAGLPWECAAYYRNTVYRTGTNVNMPPALPDRYSQKAVFLRNVGGRDACYLPNAESRIESHVFAPENVEPNAPVACARVGEGWLGYVGDVNAEEESDAVVLVMCGLM
jgi:hypothetical protein